MTVFQNVKTKKKKNCLKVSHAPKLHIIRSRLKPCATVNNIETLILNTHLSLKKSETWKCKRLEDTGIL